VSAEAYKGASFHMKLGLEVDFGSFLARMLSIENGTGDDDDEFSESLRESSLDVDLVERTVGAGEVEIACAEKKPGHSGSLREMRFRLRRKTPSANVYSLFGLIVQ